MNYLANDYLPKAKTNKRKTPAFIHVPILTSDQGSQKYQSDHKAFITFQLRARKPDFFGLSVSITDISS